MSSKPGEITENEVAHIVLQIAAGRTNGIATFDQIRTELPSYYNLSSVDLTPSPTRSNEAMWEQKIRNIKSHYQSQGNYIYEGYLEHVPDIGYRITERGLRLIDRSAA